MGQVTFMKAFMQQVPDFDQGLLGEAIKIYVVDLHQDMKEEAAQTAKVQRVAEDEEAAT